MATIKFKAKVQKMESMDGNVLYSFVQVPELTRSHCDMQAFRQHPKFGGYANSDLFKGMLGRIRADIFGGQFLRMDKLPANVSIDTSKFLAVVTIEV